VIRRTRHNASKSGTSSSLCLIEIPIPQVRNGLGSFGGRGEGAPFGIPAGYRDYSNAELAISAVPLNGRRFRAANGSGTVCNLFHREPAPSCCRVRARARALVQLARAASYITGLINVESSPMPRTGSCKMLPARALTAWRRKAENNENGGITRTITLGHDSSTVSTIVLHIKR